MTAPLRLALFIDAQNTYLNARDCFFGGGRAGVSGQFRPMALGRLIASRGGPRGAACTVSDVRVYSGRPVSNRDRRSYAAHRRQSRRWASDGATVITRDLRYPRTWPTEPAQEKGVDVALSIDFVTLAIDGAYDVGVIMSTDTDLRPALEFVRNRDPRRLHVAVAAWGTGKGNQRLSLPGTPVWCHWLSLADYNSVADPTRY